MMIKNEILSEKYRVQRRLSASCKNVQDYFKKSHDSVLALFQERGVELKFGQPSDKNVSQIENALYKRPKTEYPK